MSKSGQSGQYWPLEISDYIYGHGPIMDHLDQISHFLNYFFYVNCTIYIEISKIEV